MWEICGASAGASAGASGACAGAGLLVDPKHAHRSWSWELGSLGALGGGLGQATAKVGQGRPRRSVPARNLIS